MVTEKQIQEMFDEDNDNTPFQTKNVDHDVIAINLLRSRIPYKKCKSIICGADHDILYLCDIDDCLDYLTEEDLKILLDCNVILYESYKFALFV